jgi:hypothetical protein
VDEGALAHVVEAHQAAGEAVGGFFIGISGVGGQRFSRGVGAAEVVGKGVYAVGAQAGQLFPAWGGERAGRLAEIVRGGAGDRATRLS